jgi:predicted O-methyltransferase YrrM
LWDRVFRSLAFRLRFAAEACDFARLERRLKAAGSTAHKKIKTWTTRRELQVLFDLAAAAPPGSIALEVGSYLGASTCYLAAGIASGGGRLICVDTWMNDTIPGEALDTFSEFESNVTGLWPYITPLRVRSEELTLAQLPSELALVFLDGDHSFASVRREARLVSPIVPEGGILAFHDAIHFEGVARTIGEALAGGEWQFAGQIDNLIWLKKVRWTEPEYHSPHTV